VSRKRDPPQPLRKTAAWNTPDAAGLFNVPRLVLCTQPRSNFGAFGGSIKGVLPKSNRSADSHVRVL
jgi:hypothetical protein